MANIPIIDFKLLGLTTDNPETVDDVTLQDLVAEVKSSLTTSGFMYLRNHGIEQSTLDAAFASTRCFFELPMSVKKRCMRQYDHALNHGWVPLHGETVDLGRNVDVHESLFMGNLEQHEYKNWALDEVPSLWRDMETLFRECHSLSLRILSVISLSLGKERCFFEKFHQRIGKACGNRTSTNALYYPSFSKRVKSQLRLGEHTDYGSISLVFQDDVGGLEVWDKTEQKFLPAVPVPGTVIVNIGDALQRWTADELLSNKHRVAMQDSRDSLQRARQSLAFFVQADDDVMLACVDGSDKYPPISMGDYLDNKHGSTIVIN